MFTPSFYCNVRESTKKIDKYWELIPGCGEKQYCNIYILFYDTVICNKDKTDELNTNTCMMYLYINCSM